MQLNLANDFMHWISQQNSSLTIFDMPNAELAWRFLRFSKHARPLLRELEEDPAALPRLMASVLNPFHTIARLVKASGSTTFYTVLPLACSPKDWRKAFAQCLEEGGLHLTFLYCSSEGFMSRLLFSVRGEPLSLSSVEVSKLLAPVFRWKSNHAVNPFVPLLLVPDARTWALAAAHVAYYRVQGQVSSNPNGPLDGIELLRVKGLTPSLVRLAINYITNLPFQRQIRGIISSQPPSKKRDEDALILNTRLERGGFKVDLTMQRELVWGGYRQVANAVSCLYHIRDRAVADTMRVQLLGLIERFEKGAFFRMMASPMGDKQGQLMHILVCFDRPVLIFGENSLNKWMLDLSRAVKMCTCLSVTPLDIALTPVMNPMVSTMLACFCPAHGPERDDLLHGLRAYVHSRQLMNDCISILSYKTSGLERLPPIPFVSTAIPEMRIASAPSHARLAPTPSESFEPLRAATPIEPISPSFEPLPAATLIEPISPSIVPLPAATPIEPISPSHDPTSSSLVFKVDWHTNEFYPLLEEVLAALPQMRISYDELKERVRMGPANWITMLIDDPITDEEPTIFRTYGRGQQYLFQMFQILMGDLHPLLVSAGDDLSRMLGGDMDAVDRLYNYLKNCSAAIRGALPFVQGFGAIPLQPRATEEDETVGKKRPRSALASPPSPKRLAQERVDLQHIRLDHPMREVILRYSMVRDRFLTLVPEDGNAWEWMDWTNLSCDFTWMFKSLENAAEALRLIVCVAPGGVADFK